MADTLPLHWRERENHPQTRVSEFHLSVFDKPRYLLHAYHQPSLLQDRLTQFPHKLLHTSADSTLASVQVMVGDDHSHVARSSCRFPSTSRLWKRPLAETLELVSVVAF